MGSAWVPHGFRMGSAWAPHGFRMGPHGFRRRFRMGSAMGGSKQFLFDKTRDETPAVTNDIHSAAVGGGGAAFKPPTKRIVREEVYLAVRRPRQTRKSNTQGHSKHTQRNAIRVHTPPCSAFRLLSSPTHFRTLGHSQWPEPLNSVDASARRPTGIRKPSHSRDPITRPLRRSTPPFVTLLRRRATCHRAVLRGTHHPRIT